MWTSERNRRLPVGESAAEVGLVTLGGDPAGVNLGGERRWLSVYSPGGYTWRPSAGDRVLVLKTGSEQESPCILGVAQKENDLHPGEVRLTGEGCGIRLDGEKLTLDGQVWLGRVKLEDYIRSVVYDAVGGGE